MYLVWFTIGRAVNQLHVCNTWVTLLCNWTCISSSLSSQCQVPDADVSKPYSWKCIGPTPMLHPTPMLPALSSKLLCISVCSVFASSTDRKLEQVFVTAKSMKDRVKGRQLFFPVGLSTCLKPCSWFILPLCFFYEFIEFKLSDLISCTYISLLHASAHS